MTRSHALRQLLALGPLSRVELAEITGWPSHDLTEELIRGCIDGVIKHTGSTMKRIYRLAA